MKRFHFCLIALVLATTAARAQTSERSHEATPEQTLDATRANEALQASWSYAPDSPSDKNATVTPVRPATDFEHFRYLLMTGEDRDGEAQEFKQKVAQNLPGDMSLVLLVSPGDENHYRDLYSQWISKDRIIIASSPEAEEGFWSRDSFPYPVFVNQQNQIGVVWAKYYREFNGGTAVADSVHAPLRREAYTFVGGNLLSDQDGRCFVVESPRLFGLTDVTLTQSYGCKVVTRLKYLAGIGDADEVIKILPGKVILTNVPEYKTQLQALGYTVKLLPTLTNYRTYANSVVLGQTVFMPAYGLKTDTDAQKVYESLGYKVIQADSETLSTADHGSFHCITQAYPEVDLKSLAASLGASLQ